MHELPTYPERINAVTVDDIQRVAQDYVHPQALSIVLVGEARAFLDDLAGAGFAEYEVLSVDDVDSWRPDQRQAAAPDTTPAVLVAP